MDAGMTRAARGAAMAALIVALAGCGGGKSNATYSIGGNVYGLAQGGALTLQNTTSAPNGTAVTEVKVLNSNGGYAFTTLVPNNTTYSATVMTNPTGQVCLLENPTGTIANASEGNVNVVCATVP